LDWLNGIDLGPESMLIFKISCSILSGVNLVGLIYLLKKKKKKKGRERRWKRTKAFNLWQLIHSQRLGVQLSLYGGDDERFCNETAATNNGKRNDDE